MALSRLLNYLTSSALLFWVFYLVDTTLPESYVSAALTIVFLTHLCTLSRCLDTLQFTDIPSDILVKNLLVQFVHHTYISNGKLS